MIGAIGLAGWAALAISRGGTDVGRLPIDRGASGLMVGLAVGWALAVAALWRARRARWGVPALLGVGSVAGLLAWSALSIAWASAPDLAWLATNRTALALAALLAGAALALRVGDPAGRLAIGLSVASVPVLAWALGSRIVPDLLAPAADAPRLFAPIGFPNALALAAVFAMPGALLVAGGRWRRDGVALPILVAAILVLALSGSRSGAVAAIAVIVLALWLFPSRAAVLSTLAASVLGALPAAVYGLTADELTAPRVLPEPADRRGAGLVLGALLLVGVAVAITVRPLLAGAARRVVARFAVRGRVLLVAAAVLLAGGGVVAALGGSNSASTGADRFLSLGGNNRTAWWGQAVRGFVDAPLHGHGAGSFPLTHLSERRTGGDAFQVRQPHQLGLELLTELGVVGLALGLVAIGAVLWAARGAGRRIAPALCLVVPFLLQAQLDFPWTVPALAAPAMAAAGVILVSHRPGRSWRAGAAGVAVAAAIGAAAASGGIVSWIAADRASNAYLAASPLQAVSRAESAASLNPLAIGALMVEAAARAELGDRSGAATAARMATRRQPENPAAWRCLGAVGDGADRAEAVSRLAELDPRGDPAKLVCRPTV